MTVYQKMFIRINFSINSSVFELIVPILEKCNEEIGIIYMKEN
jgi:hypothetical protein